MYKLDKTIAKAQTFKEAEKKNRFQKIPIWMKGYSKHGTLPVWLMV
jgi:hypothetical protein